MCPLRLIQRLVAVKLIHNSDLEQSEFKLMWDALWRKIRRCLNKNGNWLCVYFAPLILNRFFLPFAHVLCCSKLLAKTDTNSWFCFTFFSVRRCFFLHAHVCVCKCVHVCVPFNGFHWWSILRPLVTLKLNLVLFPMMILLLKYTGKSP